MRPSIGALLAPALVTLASCVLPGPDSPEVLERDALERDAVEMVNRYRESAGIAPLRHDRTLTKLAREHAAEMASGRIGMGHAGFPGRARVATDILRLQRLVDEGGLVAVGENVAWNDVPQAKVVETALLGWLRSPPHRANLEACYDRTGVGAVPDPAGGYYLVQLFVELPREPRRPRREDPCGPRPVAEGPAARLLRRNAGAGQSVDAAAEEGAVIPRRAVPSAETRATPSP